ncbi:MAG: cytochrome c, partial [Gemmatimonadetes bacterium]|nr:cytochrome c [Gemmatimonadota bacterium]
MPVTPRVRTLAGIASIVVGVAPLTAQPHSAVPTFTKDVAPILYKNCTVCHRKGGMGPMPLTTYDDAKRSAGEMRDAVGTGFMPPWHADAPHGTFSNDRRLSAADKQVIAAWVDAGTPEGNPADLPPAPVYPSSWQLGTPDVILKMPVPFEVPAKGTIDYQYIEIPTNFTEDKWVQAIEMLPGAREVVHHVIVYARPPAPAPGTTPPASA